MKNLRKILFPLGWLYGGIVSLRNKFFDWKILPSKSYDFPIISVGNLSVGGTGKSPMTEYLVRLLREKFKVATLSRGYKRKTSGFYLLEGNEEAIMTGDEPLQFKTKFPEIEVAVDEDRQNGIRELRKLDSQPEVIILDDAFQHRKVKPGFSIVLTAYDSIYTNDLMLPAGNLREPRSGAKRADLIVVTKCPPELSQQEMNRIEKKLAPKPFQQIYFSYIAYADFITNGKTQIPLKELNHSFELVTGIAKPQPLVDFLQLKNLDFTHSKFPDHHNFTEKELEDLREKDFILTTEKDFMRLKNEIPLDRLFYLPIQQDFVQNRKNFDNQIRSWVSSQYF